MTCPFKLIFIRLTPGSGLLAYTADGDMAIDVRRPRLTDSVFFTLISPLYLLFWKH